MNPGTRDTEHAWLRVPLPIDDIVIQYDVQTNHSAIAEFLHARWGPGVYGRKLAWDSREMVPEQGKWLLEAHNLMVFLGLRPEDAACCDSLRREVKSRVSG